MRINLQERICSKQTEDLFSTNVRDIQTIVFLSSIWSISKISDKVLIEKPNIYLNQSAKAFKNVMAFENMMAYNSKIKVRNFNNIT